MISPSVSFSFNARVALASFFDVALNTIEGVAPNPKLRTRPCLSRPITCVYMISTDNEVDDEDSPICDCV